MITVENVTKTYGSFTAVDDVSFTAEPGRITGFLGPNGAGKSTTLRVVVGLTPPDSGAAHVLGRRFADLPNPGIEVGVLLDASAQHAGRTGREVLTIAQRTMGLPGRRVDETLEQVGLTSAEAGRRLRDYSLGMRQRLGLAHALLGDPEVLILDEPANGLDPAGIRWMRDLLRGYADRGATVLLSSHLLHEIEVVADDLVVIGKGRIVAAGTKADLLAGAGTQVLTRHPDELSLALTAAGLDHSDLTTPSEATTHTASERNADPAQPHRLRVDAETEAVGRVAHQAGVALIELRPADGAGLEEMFLELTADTARDSHDASTTGSRYQEGAVA
jgi:ABC-2 type transport system ATP-binding protein